MNSVQLLGNLARDPELRYTKTGKARGNTFDLSVKYGWYPEQK